MKHRIGSYVITILTAAYFISLAILPTKGFSAQTQPISGTTKIAEQNWDLLVAAAKKEGTVSLYSIWRPATRIALTDAFKAKYGINLEFSPFSRGPELLAKVLAEQRAGLYLADVFGAGGSAFVSVFKPAGVLGALDNMPVLPEVTDGKNWSTGKLPFVDKDRTFIAMICSPQRNIVYNSEMIKKGEITDYLDLLKPEYKGKIVMNDPTKTGPGSAFLTFMAVNIWDLAKTRNYLTQLVGTQQTVIESDHRIQVEDVARGKYPIGLAPNPDNLANFVQLGAKLDVVILKQGVRVSSAAGALAIPTKSPHPNATKLFVNWLLTKEGQTVFSKGFGNPSLRTDVTTKGFNPIFLTQPGEKVWPESEEFMLQGDEVRIMAQQVINAAYR